MKIGFIVPIAEMLFTIPDHYPNYYKALEIHTGYMYFDCLDIMILFAYPSSIN